MAVTAVLFFPGISIVATFLYTNTGSATLLRTCSSLDLYMIYDRFLFPYKHTGSKK